MATLKLYRVEIRMLCKEEIVQEPKELFKFIIGVGFPTKLLAKRYAANLL